MTIGIVIGVVASGVVAYLFLPGLLGTYWNRGRGHVLTQQARYPGSIQT